MPTMQKTSPGIIFNLFSKLILLASLFAMSSFVWAQAEPLDSIYTDEINLVTGELEIVKVYNLTRIAVSDPDIVDIVDADEEEVVILAKGIGQTVLFVWDDNGKKSIVLHVASNDLDSMKDRVESLLDSANIKGAKVEASKKEGKVVVAGQIPQDRMTLYEKLAEPFELQDNLINLVEKEFSDNQIQIDMQITELSQTLQESLGFEWGAQNSTQTGGGSGNNEPFTTLVVNYGETLPEQDGSFGDLFKLGDFMRTSELQVAVNALIEAGKGRILSKPKLMVKSGEEATFLVGGEIPIRTTNTTASGGIQENIEFKDYGIGLTITPTIMKQKVDVILNVEISEIDRANAVGGDVAFTTRTAQTHLFLEDKQTVIMAGLIKKSEGYTIKKVPLLGDVPVLGFFFRKRSQATPNQDTEIVISMTPTIITDEDIREANKIKHHEKIVDEIQVDSTALSELGQQFQPSEIPDNMVQYVRDVQQKISNAIVYPNEAKEYGWEGTVKLGLVILKDGTLAYALVKNSAGYDIFDEYALNTAKNIAPFLSFPADSDLQEINVTIPIVYSLQQN